MISKKKVVLVLSGGLDSVVLLYLLRAQGHEVHALGFDYGQRHAGRELAAAAELCAELGVPWRCVNLRGVQGLFGANALTDAAVAVPEGGIDDPGMANAVVPNRNMVFLALATGWAISLGATAVAYAVHGGSTMFPDCSPEFAQAMEAAMVQCDKHQVTLVRPFVHEGKDRVVAAGAVLGVPFARTWSCFKGGAVHCGQCGTCQERMAAFATAGVADPTEYANRG